MNIPVNVKFPSPSTQARWGLGVSVKAELIMVGVKAFSCDWIKEEKKKKEQFAVIFHGYTSVGD